MPEPIFKKRGKKASSRTSRQLLEELENEPAPSPGPSAPAATLTETALHSDSPALPSASGSGSGSGSAADPETPSNGSGAPKPAPEVTSRTNSEPEDEGTSISDIIALRQLKRAAGAGIDLQRLNEGDHRKRKKPPTSAQGKSKETLWEEQLAKGGLVSQSLLHAPSDRDGYDDERANETERKRRRLLGQDNFQSETGAVDVDKYMMAYIEEELAKRRAASGVAGGTPLPPSHRTEAEMRQAILDPNDELSKIAEQYHQLQHRPDRDTKQKDEEEGSVTLSASMLGGVPEWDLGIEAKIRNIEQTEMAKRRLRENKKQPVAEEPATNMRFAPRSGAVSENEFRAQIAEKPSEIEDNFRFNTSFAKQQEKREKRETASDQFVADRFKKRQREEFVKKR